MSDTPDKNTGYKESSASRRDLFDQCLRDRVISLAEHAYLEGIMMRVSFEDFEYFQNRVFLVPEIFPQKLDGKYRENKRVKWREVIENPNIQSIIKEPDINKNIFGMKLSLLRNMSGEYELHTIPKLDIEKPAKIFEWVAEIYEIIREASVPRKDINILLLDAVPSSVRQAICKIEDYNEAIAQIMGKCLPSELLRRYLFLEQRFYVRIDDYKKALEIYYLFSSEAVKKSEKDRKKDLQEGFFRGLTTLTKGWVKGHCVSHDVSAVTDVITELEALYIKKHLDMIKTRKVSENNQMSVWKGKTYEYLNNFSRTRFLDKSYTRTIWEIIESGKNFPYKDNDRLVRIKPKHRKVYKSICDIIDNLFLPMNRLKCYSSSLYKMKIRPSILLISIKNEKYQIKSEYKEKAQSIINMYQSHNIIKRVLSPSTVKVCSPTFIKEYPNGGIKIVVDYSMVNKIVKDEESTFKGIFPTIMSMPPFQKVFSVIYLGHLYHQIELDEASSFYTTFSIFDEVWEYMRMPEGLKTTPILFYETIKKILSPLKCFVLFLDTVVVFSESLERHMGHLKSVLGALSRARISIHRRNSRFFMDSFEYSGYIVDSRGVRMKSADISEIRTECISTAGDLRSLIGLFNRHRPFVHDLAITIKQLYDILPKTEKPKQKSISKSKSKYFTKNIKWTEENEKYKQRVFNMIEKEVVLGFPVAGDPFQMCTYYSGDTFGISTVLMQGRRLIGLFSYRLKDSMEKWTEEERELYVIYLSLKYFRNILKNSVICIYTQLPYIVEDKNRIIKRWKGRIERFRARIMEISQTGKEEMINFVNAWINEKEASEFVPSSKRKDPKIEEIREGSRLLWESPALDPFFESLDNQEK